MKVSGSLFRTNAIPISKPVRLVPSFNYFAPSPTWPITSERNNSVQLEAQSSLSLSKGPSIFKRSQFLYIQSKDGADKEIDPRKQQQNANLGSTIDTLKELIPQIASKSLPKQLVSPEVLLRVCPTHFEEFNAYLPAIKGHVPYYTSCKVLQFLLTSIVLTPNVQLHIQSIRATTVNDRIFPYYSVYPDSTKIKVRWTTSTERIHNINDDTTLLKGWSKVATTKFLDKHNITSDDIKKSSKSGGISSTLAELTSSIKNLANDKKNNLERVISGIFIFELNEDNDKIIVHTIEDIDILEKTETQENLDGGLRVC
ncbi:hypothetical protein CLIB1423_03S08328 [[Candida] railenensis]|uniref:Uncharacterized protein n=1 Tax=[Candida] railenensis TaxID=45579 RepID=A0A9P0VX44_9ASCO|nr:hypothetical protein CLIB1423_03S08328 [[Candida] railenensis]